MLHFYLGLVFSERERHDVHLRYMLSLVRLSVVCLSVCLSSVTLVHPTQPVEIFGNVSTPFSTFAIQRHPRKSLQKSSQGKPSVEGFKRQRGSQI